MIHKTTRSILSVLLAALLLVTSTPLTPAFAGEEGAVSPQSESGESEGLKQVDGVYQIGSAEELRKFAKLVNNNGETDADAVLTDDIDLSEICGENIGEQSVSWIPIGTNSRYRGTFDGNNYTISGLYIDSSSANGQGLFGYVDTGGKVKDLTVSGSVSGSGNYVGGVVGYNSSGGNVTGCYNIGDVTGNIGVGGVVGYNGGTVKNCYNTGEVSGNSVGGVVGLNDGGRVTNSYNTGAVSGREEFGGVVGYNYGGRVENCYNIGEVSGNRYVGGVVGNNDGGRVENCYNTGEVSGNISVGGVVGSNSFSATVTNCYFLQGTAGKGIGSGGSEPDETPVDDLSELCQKFTSDHWTISDTLKRPVLTSNHEDDGSKDHPYEIFTADQLENFRDLVNGANGQTADTDAHAKLMNDIDLKDVCGLALDDGQPVSWIPIGNDAHQYTGTFNGNGHKIENLYINTTDSGAYNQGLFGYLGTSGDNKGTVQNLSVSGTVNSSGDYVGGVVGYNNGGTVTGCIFSGSGSVSGSDRVGGVVGENSGSVTNCTNTNTGTVTGTDDYVGGVVGSNNNGSVTNSYNTGAVSGGEGVGGVVGYNAVPPLGASSVTNCYNIGDVSGKISVGGVVGSNNNGSVENCYNTGSVKGSGNSVGGVVGYNQSGSSVTTCYNTGTVSGSDYVGGVVGENSGSNGVVENCHNAGKVSGRYVGGVVGSNSGTVENCYNTDSVSNGTTSGGVVGQNSGSGSVTGCYFLQQNGVPAQGIGSGTGTATEKDDTAFHSGEVAYLLQSKQADGSGQVWGQTLGGEEDSLPTLVALNPGAAQPVYKVTVVYGDYADAPKTETSYTNNPATPSEQPSRDGYTFGGWDQTAEEGNTITFTAKWTAIPATYTVTFDSQGGSAVNDQTVTEGQTITEPAAPTRDGYTFAGWFTESSGGSQWNFSTAVTKNMTLYAQWTEITPDPDPTPTPTPDPTPSGPSTGDSSGWDDILDELENAEKGDQITIDMGDETKVPAEIFESVAGKDVDVTFDLGDDLSWTVNGKDIPDDAALADLDLGVALDTDGIPVNVVNAITGEVGTVQITLAHDGEFGFTMTLTAPLGKENAGYWANLYHYKVNGGEADREDPLGDDEDAEALNFEAAAKIDETGSVTIPFSHASQYAIVIDTHSHAAVDVSDIFIDVAPNAWYKDAVQYAYDNGLMTGVSATEFDPEATTTRAMIVSILARLENVTSAEAAGFADVDDEWYATAVNWAANVGVVNGYEDNTFQPNTAITREQLAAMLMNCASYKGEDVSNRADLTSYTDQPSAWAQEAISWSVAEGLLTGVTADTLQPQGAATRAQVAAILQRFLSK